MGQCFKERSALTENQTTAVFQPQEAGIGLYYRTHCAVVVSCCKTAGLSGGLPVFFAISRDSGYPFASLMRSRQRLAASPGSNPKSRRRRFFKFVSFIISAFLRVRKRSPPTTSCICRSLSESRPLRFPARAASFPPLEGAAAPMTDSTAARRIAALLQFNSFCGSRIANLNVCASGPWRRVPVEHQRWLPILGMLLG